MVDLHTHSTASDGSLSPAALIAVAAAEKITALALTDHDTLSGLEEAQQAASETSVNFIPGIELEITGMERPDKWTGNNIPTGEFHLLGLGLEHPRPDFSEALSAQVCRREERNRAMFQNIVTGLGLQADYSELAEKAGKGGIVARPHIAALLVEHHVAKNIPQAFKHYLAKGRPYYIAKEGFAFIDACRYIHESGGLAFLAHPKSLYLSWPRLDAFIELLKKNGLDGIETWHSNATMRYCRRLETIARRLGLHMSAGSDFHGDPRPASRLGHSAGGVIIDEHRLPGLNKTLDRIRIFM
jgi:predicted metal-dependent phosphoesterase TrpH